MARSGVNGRRLAGMHPWKRSPLVMGWTLPARHLVRQFLAGPDAGVGAADDVEGRPLDLGPERGHAVLDHDHPVLAVEAADHRTEDADVGHGAGDDERADAARAEGAI